MFACFQGTLAEKVNSLQKQIQRTDVVSQQGNKEQLKRLNELESQVWLYKGILERIGSDPSVNHETIARTLEALDNKRDEIIEELEPRKPKSYRIFTDLQDSARTLLASQAENDYEQLQKVVANLVVFVRAKNPSQTILEDAISELAREITSRSSQISPYRLRLAYKLEELMRSLSEKIVLDQTSLSTASNYKSIVDELSSRVSLLSREFNKLLASSQQDKGNLQRSSDEISRLTTSITKLHKEATSRDLRISAYRQKNQKLTRISEDSQAELDNLRSLIRNLGKEIQSVSESEKAKQRKIDELQREVSRLGQQTLDPEKRPNIIDIDSKKAIIKPSQNNRSSKTSARLPTSEEKSKKSIKSKIETREKISEREYQEISNQEEYEYVSGYKNGRSGKWVEPYYRRKRKR